MLAAVLQADPEELELALANKQNVRLGGRVGSFRHKPKSQCRGNRGFMEVTRHDVHPVSDWCVLVNFVVR